MIFKKIEKEKFDNIISLGYNCQTAFALQAFYFGNQKPPSNFFNWIFCSDVKSIINFINNPQIFTKGLQFNNDTYMFKDIALNLHYHSKIQHKNNLKNSDIENGKTEVISRMTYLKNKFFKLMESDSKNLFILTYPTFEDKNEIIENIYLLSKLIRNISNNKQSKIVFIFEKNYVKNLKLPQIDNAIYKYTKSHAKDESANKVDFISWYKILNSFKIKNFPKLKLKNVYIFKKQEKIRIYDIIKKN